GLTRLSSRRQSIVHVGVILISLAFLPITSMRLHRPPGPPPLQVLEILAAQVGLPYLVLASTGPLLQSWLHRATRAIPYRLYRLSNSASFLGLGTYPFLIQPKLGMTGQGTVWSMAYGVFALFLILNASVVARTTSRFGETEPEVWKISRREIVFWVGLPAA